MDSSQKRDRPSPGASASILHLCIGVCAGYYILIANVVQGDFQGDSWDYLNIAAQMRDGLYRLAEYRYLRGLFYPWFLSVTWRKDGSLTYFLESFLFLASLYLALRVIALGRAYSILAICAAMLPAVAFLQSLIYPDGMLVSFTLLFFVALALRKWWACIALGCLLALTKLVFGLVLPIALLVFLLTTRSLRDRIPRWSILGALILAPLVLWIISTYVLIDLGYMVVFARPYWHGTPIQRLFPDSELRFRCGGTEHSVPTRNLNFYPITAPESTALHGPFTENQAKALGCSPSEVHSVMRRLVSQELARDPLVQLRLATTAFAEALTGGYDFAHVSYILNLRRDSWLAHYDDRSSFEPNELRLRMEYSKRGIEVVQKPPLIFRLNEWSWIAGVLLRVLAFGALGACAIIAGRHRMLRELVSDPSVIGIAAFLASYSLVVAVSAPLYVYDRYTIVNLLLACILAARVAALTLDGKRASEPQLVSEAVAMVEVTPSASTPEVRRAVKAKKRRRS